MPRGNTKEKRLARQRQAATGEPYTTALRHVREEYAARLAASGERADAEDRVSGEYTGDLEKIPPSEA